MVDLAPMPSRRRKASRVGSKPAVEPVDKPDGGSVKVDRKAFRDTLVQKLTKNLSDMSEDKKIDAMRKVEKYYNLYRIGYTVTGYTFQLLKVLLLYSKWN